MSDQEVDQIHSGEPYAVDLNQMLEAKSGLPQEVYRLAVIMQGLMDSLDDPNALTTIRFELNTLISDISHTEPRT
jgi:hypothetical protein